MTDSSVAEAVLPTWAVASKMYFDCKDAGCINMALAWRSLCGHDLVVCHQRIYSAPDRFKYQAVLRHGNSEAVLIEPTGMYGLEWADGAVRQWLNRVHEYEAQHA